MHMNPVAEELGFVKNWQLRLGLTGIILGLILTSQSSPLDAQSGTTPLGIFESHSDVGAVLHAGTAVYDAAHGTYAITGSGENMWLGKDAFQFAWKKMSGDVSLAADITFPHPGGNPHRKAALLIRQSLDADSVYADAVLHGVGLTALQFRPEAGTPTAGVELNFEKITDAPTRLRIEKRSDHFTMFLSFHGEPLHPAGATTRVHIDGPFYIGLGVCSHDKDASETAVFSNVVLEPLSASTSDPSAKADLYSTLQTIALDPNARREVVAYSSKGRFEAPNWTRDGKSLIFDEGGRIMTVPVDRGTPQALNIGSATGCNGSHGLSPDGKWLAISCNTPGAPGSRVYILPSTGGEPRMVTQNPSSYFHSWSPDGKTIAFTRPHPGGGDIWSISVDGGPETRLTTSTGISDDPDYSPDGRYIYFNSDRGGGSMQVWRMHADGSQPEQVTSDERNNWTPHPSPDGKWIVFLSYDKGVPGHPVNKDISLRLISLSDNKITNLVDIFGGSGTINVPSWSPDSKQLAYVNYELVDPNSK
jgi:Tol biopolymer transport system component